MIEIIATGKNAFVLAWFYPARDPFAEPHQPQHVVKVSVLDKRRRWVDAPEQAYVFTTWEQARRVRSEAIRARREQEQVQ